MKSGKGRTQRTKFDFRIRVPLEVVRDTTFPFDPDGKEDVTVSIVHGPMNEGRALVIEIIRKDDD